MRAVPVTSAEKDGRVPFLLLTGFLGSGKTTLLNRLLREEGRWLVLMNEFGQEALDQQLMERRDIPLALLSGGCVCCTVRGRLAPTLRNFHMERSAVGFDGVIMEASGVADPGPVLDTLLKDRWLAARYSLSAIVATVDALRGLEQIERFPEAARQAALADRLLITKADLATPAAVEALRQRLALLNPAAETIVTRREEGDAWNWSAGVSLAQGREASGASALHASWLGGKPLAGAVLGLDGLAAPPLAGTGFASAALVFDQPLRGDVESTLARLLGTVGRPLLRVKGLLDLAGEACPVVVHGVEGRLYPLARLAAWPEGERRSRLVAISAEADREALAQFLSEFQQAVEC